MQLEETEKIFDEFWEHHACQLKQCLELRTFEKDFEDTKVPIQQINIGFKNFTLLIISFDGQEKLTDYTRMASEMTETGESLEHVDSLIEELNTFHSLCQVLVLVFGLVGFSVKNIFTVIFFTD